METGKIRIPTVYSIAEAARLLGRTGEVGSVDLCLSAAIPIDTIISTSRRLGAEVLVTKSSSKGAGPGNAVFLVHKKY